jgi:hypothetical protein
MAPNGGPLEHESDGLTAGFSRIDLDPEPGLPGPGLRLWGEPFRGQTTPLTMGALVVRSAGETAVVMASDLIFIPDAFARRVRDRVAGIAGTTREHVLLNASHDHAVPPLPGGQYWGDNAAVERFGNAVEQAMVDAVTAAAKKQQPARLGVGFGSSPISVYRRARGPDGRDHLGEVPDHPVDPAVGVWRFDDLSGSAIGVIFSFGCHPVLHGPRTFTYSSDYPGAARAVVERNIGGTALFLQACSGDVNPRYGIGAEEDPRETVEREGTVLGAEVVRIASEIRTAHRRGPQTPLPGFGISLWPWLPVSEHPSPTVRGVERLLDLPMSKLPALDEARRIQAEHHAKLAELDASGAPWLDRHIQRRWVEWSDVLVDAVERRQTTVPVVVQALRIGDAAIAAVAMEAFSATGMAIKSRSPFPHTQLVGVSNGFHGYLTRGPDLPPDGWKATERYAVPDLYAQAWLQPAAVGPAAEGMVVDTLVEMLESIR